MLLPTRGISVDRALITVGSDLLEELRGPMSVSALWDRYTSSQRQLNGPDRVTFDWFSLALASLYALELVEWTQEGYLRRVHVH